jgi:hypothetical protein
MAGWVLRCLQDMLEVGRSMKPDTQSELDYNWNRAHFGAWATVSAPLILGMGLDDPALVEAVIPIITNKHAIAVSQSWAGHPGMLLSSVDPGAATPDAAGYIKKTGALLAPTAWGGKPIHVANMTVRQAEAWCTASEECEAFTFRCNRTDPDDPKVNACTASDETEVKQTYFKSQQASNGDPEWVSFVKAEAVAAGHYAQQVWGKPLPGGGWAVIAINGNTNHTMRVSVPLSRLNISGPATALDLWADAKPVPGGPVAGGKFEPPSVAPRDSGFFKLTPQGGHKI